MPSCRKLMPWAYTRQFPLRFSPYRWVLLVLALWCPRWPMWSQDAADEIAFTRQLPSEARQHVYLFFLNGIDPFELGQLSQLRDWCQELGFGKSWYGQFYHRWYFQRVIEDIVQRDAEARFVIIGFSAGALAARDLANSLNQANIPVDLLVYIGGATLTDSPRNRPNNVHRLIHIRANDWIFRGWAIEGAENVKCEDVWHFGTPNHPETRRRLAEALGEVAGCVAVTLAPDTIRHPVQAGAAAGTQQHPALQDGALSLTSRERALIGATPSEPLSSQHGETGWGFLRATRQLRPVPPPDYSGLPYQPISNK